LEPKKFLLGNLKHEIFRESGNIPLDGAYQNLGLRLVQPGDIRVQYYFLPTERMDESFDSSQ